MRDKFRVITLVFLVVACILLVIGCASRWYFINLADTADATESTYSFYGPKIVVKTYDTGMYSEESFGYGELGLDSTHNYFNACLAMCAMAFILGVIVALMIILNIFNILPDKTWTISRCLIILLLVLNFIGVCVAAGYPSGFKKDKFVGCLNSCQEKWRGTFYGNGAQIIKFGGGAGFYLCLAAIFPSVGAVATSVASFIIGRNTPKE